MMTNIIFLLLIIFPLFIPHTSSRRILHQPFFQATYSPPPPPPPTPPPMTTTQPPTTTIQPPLLSPQSQPKHPFSSLQPPSTTTHHHFFPFFTTPPSPITSTIPSTSLPTFPANISTTILPPSSKSHVSKKLLFISLTLSFLSIILITTIVTTLLYHRHHKPPPPPSSDNHRLFPANHPISDKPSPPPTLPSNFSTPSSEFLYLGTLVSPIHDQKVSHKTFFSATTSGGYDRMGSPELHPLPPLPRQDFHNKSHNMNMNMNDGCFTDFDVESQAPHISQLGQTTAFPPPPPPPQRPAARLWEPHKEEILKPKLKGLHWDKVNSSSEKATVWDQLKCSTFQLNEEMIETLFMDNSSKVAPSHRTNQPMVETMGAADMNQMKRVLDPHKSRNIAILLRAFNLTVNEVCESILQGNVDTLGSELLGSLLKMAPTVEEEVRLKELNDASLFKLDPAEKFLKAIIDIPFAFKRVDAMLYISNFDTEIEYLEGSFETIKSACQQLRNSRTFIKLLEAVLMAGNRMNIGTNRGDAHAFKLDTLLKLIDVKGLDGKTTLLHFVVQEITRAEGCRLLGVDYDLQSELCDEVEFTKRGLEVVCGLGGELSSVKKAATMEIDLLLKEVRRLVTGLTKIREVVALNEQFGSNERFSGYMNTFLKKAEDNIVKIESEEKVSISMVKETTEYFHGNSTMEEGQSLWIFRVVRDFLLVLDRVCKEVGKINERTTVRSQSVPSNFPRFIGRHDFGSYYGEDETRPGPNWS